MAKPNESVSFPSPSVPNAQPAATIHGLAILRVPIDSLHQDPANARSHPERNLEAILGSLARHRFRIS